ncbi:MAG: RluA family pseudouridine synthase [Polyangiaceae bacterium]|nr:RluA family pseudouridine synthase [Polyangiaceae bacterium]
MPATENDAQFKVGTEHDGACLDAALRYALQGASWNRVRSHIRTGKVTVDGRTEIDPSCRVRAGQQVHFRMNAPRPASETRLASDAVVLVDAHVVVVRKPPGVSTVPFEPGEQGTLRDLVRAWLNRTAKQRHDRQTGDLGVVHRLDKETSGLLVFTRSLEAKRVLGNQLRRHTMRRRYLAIAHGKVQAATLRSRLVANRGDGLRGSTRDPGRGQEAITHVRPMQTLRGATLVSCQLETGRTHQIRIHLAEAAHPLVGERVYTRGLPGPFLQAPRLMLHAAMLGFDHPATGEAVLFEEPMPNDMQQLIASLAARSGR